MRRSRIDIVVEVLEVARNGVNKTAIVYRTNLNFKLANKYLSLLKKQGLLVNDSDKFITTDKGKTFLEQAKELTLQLETPMQTSKDKSPKIDTHVQTNEKIVKQIELQMSREIIPWLEVSVQKPKNRNNHLEIPVLAL